ncbi:TonB-dependent receptor [Macellibacteroides sp. HH-ZS]|nr:TonB-dependent receptor [Macellibacteroides sp. HH-ZS]
MSTQYTEASVTTDNKLSGRVIDENKKPVDFATVYLEGTSFVAFTDDKGLFVIQDTPTGTYTLISSRVGFNQTKLSVTIKNGEEFIIPDIVMIQLNELPEAVVLGKSEIRRQQEQPFAIDAIEAKRSHNSVGDLGKMINLSSGVRMRETGGMGSDYSFTLNGFSGKQVKFFLDGIPMDNFGASFNLSNLSANIAERIEVYKGVLPVYLGADALGGAVNIVTRKDANYLDASYSVGSFNTHRVSVNGAVTDTKSGFTLRANTFYNYSDNNYKVYVPILNLETNEVGPNRWAERFHDAYESAGLRMETGLTGRSYADYLLLGLIVSENKNDIQNGVTMESVFGAKTSRGNSVIPSVKYKKTDLFTKGLTFNFYGAYNYTNYHYTDTTARRYNWLGEWIAKESISGGETYRSQLSHKNREWLANSNFGYKINENHSVSFNYVFTNLSRKTSDIEDPDNKGYKVPQSLSKHVSGLGWRSDYGHWNATLFTKLYHMTGNSYEYVDQFTENERLSEFTTNYTKAGYGIATTYFFLSQLQAKMSFEHTYRLPEGSEMFGDGLFTIRNADLKPESSNNLNAGFAFEKNIEKDHTLALDGNFILRYSENYIQKELKDPSTQYINLGKVKTLGVEGGIKYKWKEIFNIGTTITYQNITDNMKYIITSGYVGAGKKKNLTYGDRIPNVPYFFGNVDVGFRFRNLIIRNSDFTVDYFLNYVNDYFLSWPSLGYQNSKSIIPQQIAHNISVGYAIQNGKYNINLECSNLSNEKLYDNYLLQKPGRAFNIKFRYYIGR